MGKVVTLANLWFHLQDRRGEFAAVLGRENSAKTVYTGVGMCLISSMDRLFWSQPVMITLITCLPALPDTRFESSEGWI